MSISSNTASFDRHTPDTPLVGRSREQAVLREGLDRALAGNGALALVAGAAGTGKTALAAWVAREARLEHVQVYAGNCYDLTRTPPYGPWLEALSSFDTDIQAPATLLLLQQGDDLGTVTSQALLFEQVREFLQRASAARPVLLVLEDMHWSDPASLDLLRYLARGIATLPVFIVVTYRDVELAGAHPLSRLLPLLVREVPAGRIELQTLTDDDVRTLIRHRYSAVVRDEARLVTFLQVRAEGNPFYLGEMLRTLENERLLQPAADELLVGELEQMPLPPLVRQVIEGRMAALDGTTRRLLEIAAAIGHEVPLDVWQTASEASHDEIIAATQRAIDAHLMLERSTSTSVRFVHALVRETLYHGQGLAQRRAHHRRIAEALVARPEPSTSLIASHFALADDPRAVDWLIKAGEQALVLYAAQDAVAALAQARELSVRFSGDLPLAAYRTRAVAYAMLGEFDRARRDYELILERSRLAGDRQTEWQALVDLAAHWSERDYERTGRYCQAALELAREIGEPLTIAHSLNQVANWHANLDETDVAIHHHQEALAIFEEHHDLAGIAGTLDLLGLVCFLNCDFATSVRHAERAIEMLRGIDDRQRLSSVLVMLACDGGTIDCDIAMPVYREPAFWIRCCEEGLAIARDIGWPAGEAFALWTLGTVTSIRGHLGRALTDAQSAQEIANRIGHREWAAASRYVIGAIWVELLDPHRAAVELEQAIAESRVSGSRYWTHSTASCLAALHVETGDLDRAAAILDDAIQTDKPPPSMGQRQCWFVRARLELARGNPDRALEILDRLSSPRPEAQAERVTPSIMTLRGDAFVSMGRLDDARREYDAARNILHLFQFRTLLWRVDAARAKLYSAQGMTTEADSAIHSARTTIDEIATTIADESVREHFRSQALDRLPAQPTSAGQLSPRELDVLRLLVEGQSDREIADALFISPRTVNRHVTAIFNKTGVNTRTAAAALAIRQGLV